MYINGGNICSTECDCARGAYKCSHAAAVVIHAIHNLSTTDVECKWKMQKAPEAVKSVEELFPAPRVYDCLRREPSTDDREWLLRELRCYGRFTGMAWILSPEPAGKTQLPIPTVEEIILSPDFVASGLQTEHFLNCLKISVEHQKAVERLTVGQRENPAWQNLRKGRLTASNFGVILKAKRITPSLMKRVMGEYDLSGVQAISWGITNEAEAIKAFEAATEMAVKETGLWLHLSGILGASPDGLVGDNGLLEAKCPFKERNLTIEEASQSASFCLEKDAGGFYRLKKNHIYWDQVQGQLHLSGRQLCYFVVWTTKDMVFVMIPKDESWAQNLNRLKDFYVKNIVPRLVSGGI